MMYFISIFLSLNVMNKPVLLLLLLFMCCFRWDVFQCELLARTSFEHKVACLSTALLIKTSLFKHAAYHSDHRSDLYNPNDVHFSKFIRNDIRNDIF